MQRRPFLKIGATATASTIAVTAGLLSPGSLLAARPQAAFQADSLTTAIDAITGGVQPEAGDITIKAPEIAENGAAVPVTVTTKIANIESLSILVPKNPTPLVASFMFTDDTDSYTSVRIKMGQTSDVVALYKADGKFYTAKKEVKVTIGGCGG